MTQEIIDYTLQKLREILAVPSPSGYTAEAAEYLLGCFSELGFPAKKTNKGGVIADLGGEGDGIVLSAHVDTLGAMVCEVKANGALRVRQLGGLNANNVETEDATVITRGGQKYGGTFQLENASVHVNTGYSGTQRSFDTLELLLDEFTSSKEETLALGIAVGDIVTVNPRTVITENGFIKSRFLDDKLSAAMLIGIAKYVKDNSITPKRRVYLNFTVYEEIGHGAAASIPDDVTEILGVDMGCVGNTVACTERQVSICALDSSGPYNYDMTTQLVNTAKANNISYALDVYPSYSSDCSVAVRSYDIRHALIGAGVYASHGYERSHIDGVKNTMELLEKYLFA